MNWQRYQKTPAASTPRLVPGAAHVWRLDLTIDPAAIPQLRSTLSPDELERADRFKFEQHRNQFIVSRGFLRRVLGLYLGVCPGEVQFRYGSHGKPELAARCGPGGLRFNVAHSKQLALLALTAACNIGVDVEFARPELGTLAIARRFFAAEEVAVLSALPAEEQIDAFFQCWTRKEAFIKAQGTGLSFPLDQFSVGFGPGAAPALLRLGSSSDTKPWEIRDLDPGPGYFAAVALEGPINSLACWDGLPG